MLTKPTKDLFRHFALSGLLAAMAAALVMTGSAIFSESAASLGATMLHISLGSLDLGKPLTAWLNNVLLTALLFGLGLECKREVLEGELAVASRLILVCLAAAGAVGVPALLPILTSEGRTVAGMTWTAAAATDLALVLGVTLLLGERVPTALRALLMGVAMVGSLTTITLVGLADMGQTSASALVVAGLCVLALTAMNMARVESLSAYVLAGCVLWISLLGPGQQSLLAGIVTAAFIPVRNREKTRFPLFDACQDVLPTVSWTVFPALAVINGMLPFSALGAAELWSPAALVTGLAAFPGKALGIVGLCWIGRRLGLCQLPPGLGWKEVWGVGLLCGAGGVVGFGIVPAAMITGEDAAMVRTVLLLATTLSLTSGYLFLRHTLSLRRNFARRR